VAVLYALIDLALDDVRGRVWGADGSNFAEPVLFNASDWTLETIGGVRIPVSFTSSGGDFECLQPADSRLALVHRGELGRMPGEVVSLELHASFPVPGSRKDDLH
jgi:hypothetical protein